MITCEIQMKLPSINAYIDLCRGNKYVAAKKKREIESDLAVFLMRLPKFTKPIHVDFVWVEKYRKRDPDNICAGGRKFIFDCLVKLGKLPDDSRKYVEGFSDRFEYGKEDKVILNITEVDE